MVWTATCLLEIRVSFVTEAADAVGHNLILIYDIMEEDFVKSIVKDLRDHLEVKDRTYRLKTYPQCFVGAEAVTYLLSSGYATTEEDAVSLGEGLREMDVFDHVTKDHPFKNEYLFYRFSEDEDFHGG